MLISNYYTKDIFVTEAEENNLESLQVAEYYISNLLTNAVNITNYIQFDSDLSSIIKEDWNVKGIDINDPDEKVNLLTMVDVNGKLANFAITGPKMYITLLSWGGNAYTNYSSSEYDPLKFFQQPWFKELNEMPAYDIYWLGSQPNYIASQRDTHPYVVSIARTIRSYSSVPYGYIIISLDEREISNLFETYESSQEMMLIDSQGVILSHPDNRKIGTVFGHYRDLPEDRQSAFVEVDDREYLLTQYPLSFSGWKLVSVAPYREAIGKVNQLYWTVMVILAVVVGLFLILMVSLMRRFTKPILALNHAVTRVDAGNLTLYDQRWGQDEVGRLGQSFQAMLERIRRMIRQITEEQAMKHQAELAMLQAQINPHFLFNILNSIRMRVLFKGDQDTAEVIEALSALLRTTIRRSNAMIMLQEEVHTVEQYVKLLNFRHKEIIALHISMSSECLMEQVPGFFLQPLIENAYIHGLKQKEGKIRIAARIQSEFLLVVIEDDGAGMDESTRDQLMSDIQSDFSAEPSPRHSSGLSGIGLKNVYQRMKMVYGERFALTMESEAGLGTVVTLRIPRNKPFEGDKSA